MKMKIQLTQFLPLVVCLYSLTASADCSVWILLPDSDGKTIEMRNPATGAKDDIGNRIEDAVRMGTVINDSKNKVIAAQFLISSNKYINRDSCSTEPSVAFLIHKSDGTPDDVHFVNWNFGNHYNCANTIQCDSGSFIFPLSGMNTYSP
jgi:hypothetical protein